jgi:hypothetical protein
LPNPLSKKITAMSNRPTAGAKRVSKVMDFTF